MSTPILSPFKFTSSDAEAYERRVGGCTSAVGIYALSLVPSSLEPSARILDNACGPGVLVPSLLEKFAGAQVDAVDNSADMVSIVAATAKSNGWADRVKASVMDACALSAFEDGRFYVSVTNFGIALFSDMSKGAGEIYRTLKPGGTAVVTQWRSVGWLPLLHEVQKLVRPVGEAPWSMPGFAEWEKREKLVRLHTEAGFDEKNMRIEEKKSVMWAPEGGVEEVVEMMAENLGPMTKGWEAGEKKRIPNALTKISKEHKERFLVGDDVGRRMGLKGFEAWIAIARK